MSLFQFHKLNDLGQENANHIASEFNNLLCRLEVFCQASSREFAIVKTKLEEACFFAKKAMAIQKENQEEE